MLPSLLDATIQATICLLLYRRAMISHIQLMVIAHSVKFFMYKHFHIRFLTKQEVIMVGKHLKMIGIVSITKYTHGVMPHALTVGCLVGWCLLISDN